MWLVYKVQATLFLESLTVKRITILLISAFAFCTSVYGSENSKQVLIPQIDGRWWQVTGSPMDHKYATEKQQPVDFAIWQAADGSWQLWSCIRNTTAGGQEGKTRFFYRWEGKNLTDINWKPMGIAMEADPSLGETPGGLQAPHVIKLGKTYHMFYGDWVNICHAISKDGKRFKRVIQQNGKTGMFNEGDGEHARDPMILQVGDKYHCYYTAHSMRSPSSNHRGVNYCRISTDLRNWGPSKIVAEGSAYAKGPYCAECPHIVFLPESKHYYLFNTKRSGRRRHTAVFCSSDPLRFGTPDHRLASTTPPAAPP